MVEQSIQHKGESRREHLSAAYDIAAKLMDGTVSLDGLASDVQDRSKRCLDGRLQHLSAQWSEISADKNKARLKKLIASLAHKDGELIPFVDFQARVSEDLAGFVVTAHPTFSFSADAWEYAGKYMGALAKGEDVKAATADVSVREVHPTTSPTLYEELEYARVAVSNIRRAIRIVYGILFEVAAELYPTDYKALRPKLATVAS